RGGVASRPGGCRSALGSDRRAARPAGRTSSSAGCRRARRIRRRKRDGARSVPEPRGCQAHLHAPAAIERGVGRAPTLVQNVETLAQLALIARFGPEWFRAVGTAAEPGTALVTISGSVAEPGVYEVALGTPLRELVGQAGGVTEHVRAFLVGGFFGSWLGEREAADASLLEADLRPRRARLGARAVVVLPTSACG